MKLKKLLTLILVMLFSTCCIMLSGFTFFKKTPKNNSIVQAVENNQNKVWCVTFQLVWNEVMDKYTQGNPIILIGGNPPIADELNKKLYTKDILSENSYYIKNGRMTHKLKKEIEKEIWKKFKEKSDILDKLTWGNKDSYLFYAMLKKDFNFLQVFDRYASDSFNGSKEKVKYFGIKKKSDKKLDKNIMVLFYKSEDEYAVKLNTKENEDVILLRTANDDNFENLYKYIQDNMMFDEFGKKDILKVPDINVDELISYKELSGKRIENTNIIITDALQTIKFKMDNKGGTLKSEAAIAVMKTALAPEPKTPRYFLFDKPFVLFLKESDKDKPYYAMKVTDTTYLVKE